MTGLLTAVRRSADLDVRTLSAQTVSVAGVVAAARAAGFALLSVTVVVLVGWATAADTGASASEAVAACLHTWLVAHQTQLAIAGGTFGLAPIGLTAVSGWLLFAGGSRAALSCDIKRTREVAALTCALASAYALLATVVAVLSRTDDVRPLPVTAFLGAGALAAVAGGAGAARAAGIWPSLWRRVPAGLRVVAEAAGAATVVLLTGGALVVAGALAAKFPRIVDLAEVLDAGPLGLMLLGLLSLAYVPTAVLWGTSVVVGPGFAVGTGTSVALTGSTLGATPAFPPLAALPADGGPPGTAVALMLLSAAAGVVAGVLIDRRDQRGRTALMPTWRHVLMLGGGAGAGTGIAMILGSLLTDGPGGPGRLADVGPAWWQMGPAAAAWVAAFATVTLFARRSSRLQGVLPRPLSVRGRSATARRSRTSSGTPLGPPR